MRTVLLTEHTCGKGDTMQNTRYQNHLSHLSKQTSMPIILSHLKVDLPPPTKKKQQKPGNTMQTLNYFTNHSTKKSPKNTLLGINISPKKALLRRFSFSPGRICQLPEGYLKYLLEGSFTRLQQTTSTWTSSPPLKAPWDAGYAPIPWFCCWERISIICTQDIKLNIHLA